MDDDPLRYDVWIEEALRAVIRRTLRYAADNGLPGEHYFYVTFRTGDEGVDIPNYLVEEHPEEMTIVLQFQYEDLTVKDGMLAVTLRFGGKPERLVIPLSAITSFADPSVNFGLQLKMSSSEDEEFEFDVAAADDNGENDVSFDEPDEAVDDEAPKTGEVIALDAFRKK